MTNLDAALALASQGLPVFPCQTHGTTGGDPPEPLHKRPCPGVMWRSAATTDPSRIRGLWGRHDDAAPGVHLELSPYFVVDCDAPKVDGGVHGIEWFRALCLEHDLDLDTVPIVRTPSGGWHVYFRRPAGRQITNSRGALPPKPACGLDIRGAGGYVIGAGSEIDIGRYELLDGPEIEAAPEPPAWLLEILSSRRSADVVPRAPVVAPRAVTGREQAYASKGLDDECRIVAATPPGARNNQLNESAFKVGRMVGAGWIGYGEARAALVAAVAGWKDARKTLGTLDRALDAGVSDPRDPLPADEPDERAAELAAQVATVYDAETGEIFNDEIAPDDGEDDRHEEFPDDELHPGGLVEEIADWIMATSARPIRLFATAAALVTVGALVARQVYSGTPRTGTHLYTLMIAGTGGGKDRPQEAVAQILEAAGRHGMCKGAFSSSASIGVHLGDRPAQVHIIDEISAVLRKLNNTRSSNAESAMLEAYCTLWGRSTGQFRPDTTTMRNDDPIVRPWVSIVGATTHTAFREQMKSKNISNGFFNRFLVLPRFERVDWRDDVMPSDVVPESIVEKAKSIMAFDDDRKGNLPQSVLWMGRGACPEMHVLGATDEAEAMLRAARDRQEEKMRLADDDPLYEIWVRSAEMIRRVATIVAVGRHPTTVAVARIEARDVAFAERLVSWSMATFQRELAQNMADTQHQADMLHVLGIIRKAKSLTRSELIRKVNGRFNSLTMNSIMDILEGGGYITKTDDDKKPKRGPKAKIYKYLWG